MLRQLALIAPWIRGPELPVTLGHLRAAGRRKETPKKAVVAGGTATAGLRKRVTEKCQHRGRVTQFSFQEL